MKNILKQTVFTALLAVPLLALAATDASAHGGHGRGGHHGRGYAVQERYCGGPGRMSMEWAGFRLGREFRRGMADRPYRWELRAGFRDARPARLMFRTDVRGPFCRW